MRTRRLSLILVGLLVLAVCAPAFAHVFLPPGCPSGVANQGGRVVTAEVAGGRLTLAANRDPNSDDNSVHFLWCWDEGLNSELMWGKSQGTVGAGKAQATVSLKIPAGVKQVHYVILYDHGDPSTYTWGTDGWIKNL